MYLGTWVSYNLCDDTHVHVRIANANASMGKLKSFWRDSCVDLRSKYFIFVTIPLNMSLWGCEIWALHANLLRELEMFLHRSVRNIMQIDITQVIDEHITNASMRTQLYNILTAKKNIAARQLTFLGKIFRCDVSHPSTKLLIAWCNHSRKLDGPFLTNKKSIVNHIKLVVPSMDEYGSIKSWGFHALDNVYREVLGAHMLHPAIRRLH